MESPSHTDKINVNGSEFSELELYEIRVCKKLKAFEIYSMKVGIMYN